MRWILVASFSFVLNLMWPPLNAVLAADNDCKDNWNKDYLTYIGSIKSVSEQLATDGELHSLHFSFAPLRHFRVRVRAEGGMPLDWRLTFYDEKAQHPLQIMGPKDFTQSRTVWSRRFDGTKGQAVLDVNGSSPPPPFLTIDGAITVGIDASVTYYSVDNPSAPNWLCLSCPQLEVHKKLCDLQPVRCTTSSIRMRRRGEGVGMMMVFGATEAWTCSGFLIGPDLFLTNWHCGGVRSQRADSYWDNDSLRNIVIDFSWDGDSVSNEYGWSGEAVTKGHNVLLDRDLDYALFRVKPLSQSIGAPPVVRLQVTEPPTNGMSIHIIHHPLSRVKHLTAINCKVLVADYPSWFSQKPGVDFLHSCDTEGGSSGAPIFNEAGYVIGVHHSGHTLDQNGKCDRRNKAVKLPAIVASLPAKVRKEILDWQQ